MSSAINVRELVEKLHAEHQAFKQIWNEPTRPRGFSKVAPTEISLQRKKLLSAEHRLFEGYLEPLDQRFRNGEEQAINEVIDFLVIDIPAFRCGYVKEKWLRKLKSTPLIPEQKQRLVRAAISLCASPSYRREMAEWNRLMIKLADESFVHRLGILTEDPNPLVKEKAKRMIYVILNSRKGVIEPGWLQSFWLNSVLPTELRQPRQSGSAKGKLIIHCEDDEHLKDFKEYLS